MTSSGDFMQNHHHLQHPGNSAVVGMMNTKQHISMHPPISANTKYGPPDPLRRPFPSSTSMTSNNYTNYLGNIFSGFDDNILARAEALAAVDNCAAKMNQGLIKNDGGGYLLNSGPHLGAQTSRCSQIQHRGFESCELLDQMSAPLTMPSMPEPVMSFNQHHHGFHGPTGLNSHPHAMSIPASMHPHDSETDPRELEAFAERFKQRRIKLGVTQADVGKALANLKIPGVGSLSQSTICRFESLTLSHNNMIALKPILQAWLEEAEAATRSKDKISAILNNAEKKRKRTSIAAPEKRSLEAYFAVQPRPSGEKIAAIAEKLDLKKNVVRVWFCNQRQKQKRLKFSAGQR